MRRFAVITRRYTLRVLRWARRPCRHLLDYLILSESPISECYGSPVGLRAAAFTLRECYEPRLYGRSVESVDGSKRTTLTVKETYFVEFTNALLSYKAVVKTVCNDVNASSSDYGHALAATAVWPILHRVL